MKKLYVGLWIGIVALGMVACKNTSDMDVHSTDSSISQIQEDTPAQILLADFYKKMDDGQFASTDDLANALVENPIIEFAGATMPVEPGFLNGFTEEITGFSKGTMFGPSIGAIPFIGYVFEVNSDVEAFRNTLLEKSDLRWNVCTQADEKVCEASDNMVFFVMAPKSFDEEQ